MDPAQETVFSRHDVYDAHCHPTDTLSRLESVPKMRARILLIMATRGEDQQLVLEAASRYGISKEELLSGDLSQQKRIIPAFGWHPWFSHQMYFLTDFNGIEQLSSEQKVQHYRTVLSPAPSLQDDDMLRNMPDPQPFEPFLAGLGEQLERNPIALLGEVGLDKGFRVPSNWLPADLEGRDQMLTPGGREGRTLTQFRVDMNHQRRILLAQLAVAARLGRAASVHGVQAHGILHDTLASMWKGFEKPSLRQKKRQEAEQPPEDQLAVAERTILPCPPRICLHSFSGPAETVKQYTSPKVPCDIYFSFSVTINSWSGDEDDKVESAVKAVPDNRILMESDLHTAGEDMDRYLQQVATNICRIKGWTLDEGLEQLARNWKRFVLGEAYRRKR